MAVRDEVAAPGPTTRTPAASAAAAGAAVGSSAWAWLPVLVAVLVFLAARQSLIDDAYITLSYARTLAEHGEWGLVPGIPSNTQTSPLNVLLVAALALPTGSALVAAGVVWTASAVAVGGFTAAIARAQRWSAAWAGPVAGVSFAASPLMASTIGLDTAPAVALVIALAWAVTNRGPVAAGVVGGLLVLCRPDLALFALIGWACCGRRSWLAALVTIAVALPWHVLSWLLLGSAIPDTFFIKTGATDGWFHLYLWANAPAMYWRFWPVETVAVVPLAAVGVVVAAGWALRGGARTRLVAVLAGGPVAYWVALWLLSTPGSHWYFGTILVPLSVLAVLGAAAVTRLWPRLVVSALVLAMAVVLAWRPAPWAEAPFMPNWGTAPQYEAAAADLPDGLVVNSPGEIGALSWACDTRCTLVDEFSDQGRAQVFIDRRVAESGPWTRRLLELNFTHRERVAPLQPAWKLSFRADPGSPEGVWPVPTTWRGEQYLVLDPVPPPTP
ncbi:hypothetical protein [Actinomycetospora lemnae]|uniref:4-amino-4-deoxy-L-arabinose transferase-like glycosyltransferase n=1 Tax=Actinomycetospora lemnae TaxID=3019891 RepID=A0ABT5SU31_9PSEU|nr:hypothetical protein [Actinomycetospora sp. DW7H6]MDD7966359.1 hypothetical protein [Actinomycetospora sp. DW7H6]